MKSKLICFKPTQTDTIINMPMQTISPIRNEISKTIVIKSEIPKKKLQEIIASHIGSEPSLTQTMAFPLHVYSIFFLIIALFSCFF